MFLRSSADIKKGEQIFDYYVHKSFSYAQRQRILLTNYRFSCQCPLCLEQKDNQQYETRTDLANTARGEARGYLQENDYQKAISTYKKAVTLIRQSYTKEKYRFELSLPFGSLGNTYMKIENYKKAMKYFKLSFKETQFEHPPFIISMLMKSLSCAIKLKNTALISKAADELLDYIYLQSRMNLDVFLQYYSRSVNHFKFLEILKERLNGVSEL